MATNKFKFNIGDRVKYTSGIHGDSILNPLWGGKQGKITGTVRKVFIGCYCYYVKWDNGCYNHYRDEDIEFVSDDPFIFEIESLFDDVIKEFSNGKI